MTAAIYIRKSREDKKRPGFRLTVQREQLPAHARAQGWTYEIYDDGHASAARENIPDLRERARLEADIRAGRIGLILTIELSRLSRDDTLQDYVAWLHLCSEHGVKLATTTRQLDPSQPSDWMLLLMEGGFSSVEMRIMKQRMEEGREQGFRQGKYVGGKIPPPYIYDPASKCPRIDPDALVKMQAIWRMARTMNGRQIALQMGLPHIFVRRAISDDRLLFCQALRRDPDTGEMINCTWEPCLSEDDAARIRCNRRDNRRGWKNGQPGTLFSRLKLLTCGYCGDTVIAMNGYTARDGKKSGYAYYYCHGKYTSHTCTGASRYVPQPFIDEAVVTNLFGTLGRLDRIRSLWEATCEQDDTGRRIRAIDGQELTLQTKKQRLVAAIADGVLSFADARLSRQEIDAQLADLARQKSDLRIQQAATDPASLAISRDEFNVMTWTEQREFLTLAIRNVRVYNTYILINYRFPRTVTGAPARVHIPPAGTPVPAKLRIGYMPEPAEKTDKK